jgi:hypothetical protein
MGARTLTFEFPRNAGFIKENWHFNNSNFYTSQISKVGTSRLAVVEANTHMQLMVEFVVDNL